MENKIFNKFSFSSKQGNLDFYLTFNSFGKKTNEKQIKNKQKQHIHKGRRIFEWLAVSFKKRKENTM